MMPNYSYHVLSPTEFENLARDIIQKKEKIILETFKEGKDSGIDLLHHTSDGKKLIVQAKRYKDNFDVLFKKLKDDELSKVRKLKPDRYILVTSVGLTPKNKADIVDLFEGFILNTGDIIGKDDIDNLITLFPDLEKEHHKLWLSSTTILQQILNSKEINQSKLELDTIVEEIKFYVMNESFKNAREIIKKENFVVISGIPGIGKTTLARMLSYQYLGEEFEDFVYVSGSIDDALSLYVPEKKQIFFYDDFLGENFLSEKLSKNEDKRILSFINKIKKDPTKLLIMTTREYILKQAETNYPLLEELLSAKATLELGKYTPLIRAQILFNHLYFNDIDPAFLDNILENKNYFRIIHHKNYSPRIISIIVKDNFLKNIDPNHFTDEVVKYLDNPFKVWENTFETKITSLSQLILKILAISSAPILVDDLRHSLRQHISFTGPDFRKSLKELEHTFISISADQNGVAAVEFQNNSIQDYLLEYLKKNKPELIELLENIAYISQGFDMFKFPKSGGFEIIQEFSPINHDHETLEALKTVIIKKLEILRPVCRVFKSASNDSEFVWKRYESKFEWLFDTMKLFDLDKNVTYRTKLIGILESTDPYEMEIDSNFLPFVYLRSSLMPYLNLDISKFISNNVKKVIDFETLERFCEVAKVFENEFYDFVFSEEGKILQENALIWCRQEFLKGIAPSVNPAPNDFMTRVFYKAEMERICEEINSISRYLNLGIYLDPDENKEFVRSKLKEKAVKDNFGKDQEIIKMEQIIDKLFKSLKN